MGSSERMVFLSHLDTEGIGLVAWVLDKAEERIDILIVRIYGIAFLVLRFEEQCPFAIVITKHHNGVKVNSAGLFDSIGDIQLGYVLQLPSVKSGNTNFLTIEVAVIRPETQGSVRIVEADIDKSFFLQGIANPVFGNAGEFILRLQRCPCRQYHVNGLSFLIPH